MPEEELCYQAAANIGLASSIVDFDKMLSRLEYEGYENNLSTVLVNLKSVLKETKKIQKFHAKFKDPFK